MNVRRYERLDGFFIAGSAMTDSDGFLRDSPIVARTGIYLYQQPDGTVRREYRPPEEVFNEDSVASFIGKPIVVEHPKEGKVNSNTVRKLAIGTILSPGYRKTANDIACDIVIHDPKAIGDRRALSLGYRVDLDETAGVTPDGEAYDAVQRNIRINHLAVVQKARAGINARLNLDGDEIFEYEESGERLMKIRIDSKEFEVDENVANYINSLQTKEENARVKLDTANTELDAVKAENTALKKDAKERQDNFDTVTADRDCLKAKLDKAEEEKKAAVDEAVANLKKALVEEQAVKEEAKKAKIEKTDGMSVDEMKHAIIHSVFGDKFKIDGMSNAYVDGVYSAAKEMLNKDAFKGDAAKVKGVPQGGKQEDVKTDSAESARKAMLQRMEQAHIKKDHSF